MEFAEDGSQALTKIRESQPDVIVTDLQMPNRNGLELVTAVRMHHSDVPIILMTAVFGGLIVLSKGSAIAPFIYTLF